MNDVRLTVRRPNGEPVAVLRRSGGRAVVVEHVDEALRRDYMRWLEHGLAELVGPPGRRDERYTAPTDANFFKHLGAYLRRYGYSVELRPVPPTRAAPTANVASTSLLLSASTSVRSAAVSTAFVFLAPARP